MTGRAAEGAPGGERAGGRGSRSAERPAGQDEPGGDLEKIH